MSGIGSGGTDRPERTPQSGARTGASAGAHTSAQARSEDRSGHDRRPIQPPEVAVFDRVDEAADRVNEVLVASLEEVAVRLNHAVRLRGFYPNGHNAIRPALSRLGESLKTVLAEESEITLGAAGDRLIFKGTFFGHDRRAVRELAAQLKARNISSITFRANVSEEELEKVVEILSAPPELFLSEESPLLKPDAHLPHIDLHRIRYDKLLRFADGFASDGSWRNDLSNFWRSLISEHLLCDSDELPDDVTNIVATAAFDKDLLEPLPEELAKVLATRKDRLPKVAKGLAKICKALASLPKDQRKLAMHNIADILKQTDQEVVIRMLENERAVDPQTGIDLLREVARRMSLDSRLRVLAALVHSGKSDTGRLSSLFKALAGPGRHDQMQMLRAMKLQAEGGSGEDPSRFKLLWSAVQDLVLSECEGLFVGSDYASLLEELGEQPARFGDSPPEEMDHLSALLQSETQNGQLAQKVRFLTDIVYLHEDDGPLVRSLEELTQACRSLCEKASYDPVIEAMDTIARGLILGRAKSRRRAQALAEWIPSVLKVEWGQSLLDVMVRQARDGDSTLGNVLRAAGPQVSKHVCALVARSDEALASEQVQEYLRVHPAATCRSAQALIKQSPPVHVRRLLRALSLLSTDTAVDIITSCLEDPEPAVQSEAVRALAASPRAAAKRVLRELLNSPDPQLRLKAASSLGDARSQDAVPIMIASLGRVGLFGRGAAEAAQIALALGRIGDPTAVPHLGKLLRKRTLARSHDKRRLRECVAIALGTIGDDSALEELRKCAVSRNSMVREVSSWALERCARSRACQSCQDVGDGNNAEDDPNDPAD